MGPRSITLFRRVYYSGLQSVNRPELPIRRTDERSGGSFDLDQGEAERFDEHQAVGVDAPCVAGVQEDIFRHARRGHPGAARRAADVPPAGSREPQGAVRVQPAFDAGIGIDVQMAGLKETRDDVHAESVVNAAR